VITTGLCEGKFCS